MMGQGLGCAIENMAVMASSLGYSLFVDDSVCNEHFYDSGLVARLQYTRITDTSNGHHQTDDLKDLPEVKAIFNRQTNRSSYTGIGKVSSHYFDAALEQKPIADVGVTWLDDRAKCQDISEVCSVTVREFLSGDATNDAMKWFRRNRAEMLSTGDGISIFQNDAPILIKHWMQLAATKEDLVNQQSKQSEIDMVDTSCDHVPMWGVIHSSTDQPKDWLSVGRVLEKCYLLSAKLGYAICPVSYPVESIAGREALRQIAEIDSGRVPQALVRVGLAPRMEKSVRRPLQSVLV
ncbi:hypothetical protein C9J03_00830 [Photobacterium gaetbulicola]|uniref:Nitroreductase domain-containing protein n=2 Tax=Photobacterium gaetbulicola TaxID=1295392 RepID=A0A0C5W2V0_9GAMM|nr:hypothetical protein H744_1c0661 [Photobacterium gaetbulicola Gung47]PSU14660.1 hypothetical protein C9J03_00830 [Photobacterium gaetbulicola]